MEYLTIENITALFTALLVLERVLRAVAPLTKTTVDDGIVEKIDSGRNFIRRYSASAWAIVEGLEKSGIIKKTDKIGKFISTLEEAYKAAEGQELSASAKVESKLIAAGMSAAAKLPFASPKSLTIPTPQAGVASDAPDKVGDPLADAEALDGK